MLWVNVEDVIMLEELGVKSTNPRMGGMGSEISR